MKKIIKSVLKTAFPDHDFTVVKITKKEFVVLWQDGKSVNTVKDALVNFQGLGVNIRYMHSFSPRVNKMILLENKDTLANSPLFINDLRSILERYHNDEDFSA